MKAFAAILSLALLAAPAAAQEAPCGPYDRLTAMLGTKYMEAPQMRLQMPSGDVLEVWVNTGTASWTLIQRQTNGIACARAAGEGFSRIQDQSGRES